MAKTVQSPRHSTEQGEAHEATPPEPSVTAHDARAPHDIVPLGPSSAAHVPGPAHESEPLGPIVMERVPPAWVTTPSAPSEPVQFESVHSSRAFAPASKPHEVVSRHSRSARSPAVTLHSATSLQRILPSRPRMKVQEGGDSQRSSHPGCVHERAHELAHWQNVPPEQGHVCEVGRQVTCANADAEPRTRSSASSFTAVSIPARPVKRARTKRPRGLEGASEIVRQVGAYRSEDACRGVPAHRAARHRQARYLGEVRLTLALLLAVPLPLQAADGEVSGPTCGPPRPAPAMTNPKGSEKNVLGQGLAPCSQSPATGFYRTGTCSTGPDDHGTHVVCATLTKAFLDFTVSRGNDLVTPRPEYRFPGLKPGDRWCLCASRWREALQAGVAPPVRLASTHEKALEFVRLEDLQAHAEP